MAYAVLQQDEKRTESFVRYFVDGYGADYDPEKHVSTLRDLIGAGMETSATFIRWAIVLLANRVSVQERLQSEIDTVIDRQRLPTLDDRSRSILTFYCVKCKNVTVSNSYEGHRHLYPATTSSYGRMYCILMYKTALYRHCTSKTANIRKKGVLNVLLSNTSNAFIHLFKSDNLAHTSTQTCQSEFFNVCRYHSRTD